MPKVTDADRKPITDAPMPASAFGQVRAELARLGYSQQQINDAIGTNVGGRDKREIVAVLRELMRSQDAAIVRSGRQP